jgi:phosphate/phosphite/phosphonate ABC transporter binding protein
MVLRLSGTPLSFGLVQTSPSDDANTRLDDLLAWLRTNAGVDLEPRPATDYMGLAGSVREASTDVAWLPPVVYAWLAEAVTPVGSIVREGRTTYTAALIVQETSRLETLSDLVKVRAGWVDAWSAAGYVVPRLELARAGIDPLTAFQSESFHGSHREVVSALARGDCDVVGTYARAPLTGENVTEGAWTGRDDVRVRVLASFGAIPADVLAVRRNLAPRDYERVRDAFRLACQDPAGRELVRGVFGGEELREGVEAGHDALRRAYESGIANGLFD